MMQTDNQAEKRVLSKRLMAIAIVLVFAVSAADFYSALSILFPRGTNTPIIEPILGIFFGGIYGLIVIKLPPIVSLGNFGRLVFCFAVAILAHFSPYWVNWYELSHYSIPSELREHVFSHEKSWWGYGDSSIYHRYCTDESVISELGNTAEILSEFGWTEVSRHYEGGSSTFVEGTPSESYLDMTYLSISISQAYWNCSETEHQVSISLYVKPSYSDDVLFFASLAGAAGFLVYGLAALSFRQ